MFYKVTQDDIRKDNPSIDAVEEFSPCTSVELKYIVLLYDYDTPFRALDWTSRKYRAAIEAGYKKNRKTGEFTKKAQDILDGDVNRVQLAASTFRILQKDIDKEALQTYNIQLEQFIEKAAEPKESNSDWDLALKISKALPDMLKDRKEIQQLLDIRGTEIEEDLFEEDEKIVKTLSTLDQMNQELTDNAK